MAAKNYQLNITKSDGTSETVSFAIPDKAGTYKLKFTLSNGEEIDAGNITVGTEARSYKLKFTLSNGEEIDAGTIETPIWASPLNGMSWTEIAAISEAGNARDVFAVGDEKTIALSTGETVTAVILGFNHDDLADGTGKAGITFGLKNSLKQGYAMNASGRNAGGWKDSEMRGRMSTFKSYLPSALQSALKAVTKKTSAGHESKTIDSTSDELFLFSLVEVCGRNMVYTPSNTDYAAEGEGMQYEFYKNARIPEPTSGSGSFSALFGSKGTFYTSNKSNASDYINKFGKPTSTREGYYYNYESAKGKGDDASSASSWWFRSPNVNNYDGFCIVGWEGWFTYNDAKSTIVGVSFGFCV